MLFKSPRGTKDILPHEASCWREVEGKARSVFAAFAYEEIRTPVFEEAKLFSRSLGDLTDIVQKQMFLIKREDETFVLRPEATASIVRAYLENNLYNESGVLKFFYMGPMFRAERPQKGRLRQFHHIGCEAIGSASAYLDAEVVSLAAALLLSFGVSGFTVHLNSLGCLKDKKAFALSLKEKLLPHQKAFCEDCQARMSKNIFRVLDCKNASCREKVVSLKIGHAHLCDDCRRHFDDVNEGLDILGVSSVLNPLLVRGLDYYTRTVFEITHQGLGAQDAIGAGGRYDHLVEELGGPARGAVGFAFGVERLLLAKEAAGGGSESAALDCTIIALGDAALKKCLKLAQDLRGAGVRCDLDYLDGSLKAKLRRADKNRARFCVLVGDNELAKGAVVLKDMRASTQEEAAFSQLIEKIKGSAC